MTIKWNPADPAHPIKNQQRALCTHGQPPIAIGGLIPATDASPPVLISACPSVFLPSSLATAAPSPGPSLSSLDLDPAPRSIARPADPPTPSPHYSPPPIAASIICSLAPQTVSHATSHSTGKWSLSSNDDASASTRHCTAVPSGIPHACLARAIDPNT